MLILQELQLHPAFAACSPAQRDIISRWFTAMKLNVRAQRRTPHPHV
jgi:hypothetical protein